MISVVIPFKDREKSRLNEVIKRLKNPLVKEIILVDYNSEPKCSITHKSVKIIEYKKAGPWNKAHAINIGVKNSSQPFIMTLDADILLGPEFYNKLEPYLDWNNFIYSKDVRRIEKKSISNDWDSMVTTSEPWGENRGYMWELNHQGTGGVQVFPKDWFMNVRGVDENLFYYGGMDNITLIDAKKAGLSLVTLSDTILHIEHSKRKEENLPEEERRFAQFVRKDRRNLLNSMLLSNKQNNPGFFGELSGPNTPLYKQYKVAYKKYLQSLEDKGMSEDDTLVQLNQPADIKIMVVPINNRDSYPVYFAENLLNLLTYTKQIFPNTELVNVNACDVNHLRNVAVDLAIDNKYDYIVQLDVDHVYPKDFILKLLSHEKDFVTGLTMNRTLPLTLTQFKELKPLGEHTRTNKNQIKPDGKLQKIEATGVVGMLMKVDVLKNLPRPRFRMEYHGEENTPFDSGGDFYFCKLLKEFGKEIYCDTKLEFPHHNTVEISQKGLRLTTTKEYKDWEKKNKQPYYIPTPELPKDL